MKRLFPAVLLIGITLGVVTAFAMATTRSKASERWHAFLQKPATQPGDPSHGEYLANIAGCVGCHTNYGNNGALLAGGVAIETPFGTFLTPNISISGESGIGGWSDEQFAKALVLGTNHSGEHYYPAFPYNAYTNMSAQDIADVFAWIKTIAPANNKNSPHQLSLIARFRPPISLWKSLYFKPMAKPATGNRGAYLVSGPGHCAECHSQRNLLGGLTTTKLNGNTRGPDGETVPGISVTDLAQWAIEDIDLFLEVGITPSGDSTGGHMADVIEYNTSFLTSKDRQAIARYLKSESNS
ncbi:MAG: cytochrome c [Granulosicoccaceae bacterium]